MINVAIVEDSAADANVLCEYVHRAVAELDRACEIRVFERSSLFFDGYRGNYDVVFMGI